MVRVPRQCDERFAHNRCPRGRDGCAIASGSPATKGLEAVTGGQVDHQRCTGTVAVDRTEAGGEPGDATTGVGGTIKRIKYHGDVGVRSVDARFLREHTDARSLKNRKRRRIRSQITVILASARAGEPPVLKIAERVTYRFGRLVKDLKQDSVVHGVDGSLTFVAIIDVPGFIADLKDHAVDHAFHVHDERHFIETYSMRQAWEIDLHPEDACGGPLDLHLSLEVDPRIMIGFEDKMLEIPEGDDPVGGFSFPLAFTWTLPPLRYPPDLLVLATELAGVGGVELPLEVSAIDSFASVTDAPERSLTVISRIEVGLDRIYLGQEQMCDVLDTCHNVSIWLLDRASIWLGES